MPRARGARPGDVGACAPRRCGPSGEPEDGLAIHALRKKPEGPANAGACWGRGLVGTRSGSPRRGRGLLGPAGLAPSGPTFAKARTSFKPARGFVPARQGAAALRASPGDRARDPRPCAKKAKAPRMRGLLVFLLGDVDSNHDYRSQSPMSYP